MLKHFQTTDLANELIRRIETNGFGTYHFSKESFDKLAFLIGVEQQEHSNGLDNTTESTTTQPTA